MFPFGEHVHVRAPLLPGVQIKSLHHSHMDDFLLKSVKRDSSREFDHNEQREILLW